MKTALALLGLITSIGGSLCTAGTLAGPVTNAVNGHIYYLLSQNNWTGSEAEAVTLDGHLATIDDQAENDWVFSTFGSFGGTSRALWIGLTDQQSEGNFVWISGEAVRYTNWAPTQPDNGGSSGYTEHYAHMWPPGVSTGNWNDYGDLATLVFPVVTPLHGVVEIEPPPPLTTSIRCSQVEVCWNSYSNRLYNVQYRSELTTNQWTDLLPSNIVATGSEACVLDDIPRGRPQRYYRVVEVP